ncbi:hypothetical protein Tel_04580 [Candidatus Tenderia electrophaga]|jgi:hypothetical protein|uniref:Uncharacterized protein n=1 Tax=Candidatus Tenderia electrophaga TaxID=1748243 RepID=A0A0S2TBE8_9GAMM|nr:hypothetical protein Tel_04580 [Candidatus Tenderia electrophaga]
MSKVMVPRKTDYGLMMIAMCAGCLITYLGGVLLGIRVELYYGLATFNWAWGLQIYFIPFIAGIAVGLIYGYGGKWIAHFPPLLVLLISYWDSQFLSGVPDGYRLMPMGWWSFFVILAMEFCAFGGVIGELFNKRLGYRRF